MQLVKQCIWQQGRHMKDCHGPSLHIVPVVANRSARRTTSIGTWSCVPGEMGGSRLRDEQQVLNIQQQPRPPLKEAAWGGGGRLLGVHQALLDLKEECQSKEAHKDLQEETVLVTSAGADLKDSPNFSRPVCDMDLDSKSILGSHMKVVHTCWIVKWLGFGVFWIVCIVELLGIFASVRMYCMNKSVQHKLLILSCIVGLMADWLADWLVGWLAGLRLS